MATCYLHPYEIDTREMDEIPYRVPTLLRWSQDTNRRSVARKLRRLLSRFRFGRMDAACQEVGPLEVGLDLAKSPATYEPVGRYSPLEKGAAPTARGLSAEAGKPREEAGTIRDMMR